ncbi:MAG: cell division protein FtsB [Arsenophonus sp. ET-DL9-MAG3]
MHKLTLMLLIVLFWLQYSLWFGKNGIHDYLGIKKQIASLNMLNMRFKKRNECLFTEINDLDNGSEAIEERARIELGMIISGESFYRIINENSFFDHK